MKRYKDVTIHIGEHGKFYVYTKAGLNYICRPPNARDEAIKRAKEIRIGAKPICLLGLAEGKYSEEIVA